MPTPYEDLNIDQLFHLSGSYSNYIVEFDYENAGQPVSIFEFYQCDYWQLIEDEEVKDEE